MQKRGYFSSSEELIGAWMIMVMARSAQSQNSFLRRSLHDMIIDRL